VSFEIEPYSWAVFAKSDPASIERLRRFLADATAGGRVEIVSGAYGQAYMWNASGESNIRQIAYGLAELRAVFPDLVVDTYAVQEPCWTSCLPQLLKSFGYRRAVLKNSTCWGGYHAPTLDADLVHWVGPDGTALPAVPRYGCEELVAPATTRGAQPTIDFLDRCASLSIAHPAGTTLQDMGWPGRPWRFGMRNEVVRAMRHVTWREYVDAIADAPKKAWHASQEDVRVGLAWGAPILQRIAQIVRRGENQVVQAEKIAAIAHVRRGHAFPVERLDEIWRLLLWSQHHDVWIVPYNRYRRGGGVTWAAAADEKFAVIDRTCKEIVRDATAAMAAPGDSLVRVFNTTGFQRRDLASIDVPAGRRWRVTDAEGRDVPSQVVAADGERASLLFAAAVPATGYATYTVEAIETAAVPSPAASATKKPDGAVILETDRYTVAIDPAKGGRIRSLFCKELRREFVDAASPRSFNEFRGFFSDRWLSSADAPAEVRVVEDGPLRTTAHITGRIGPWPFTTRISLTTGQRRIDFRTTFDFPLDPPGRRATTAATQQARLRVGQPWEPGRDVTRSNQRPFYDGSFKLQALFPAALRRPTLYKNAPFDVCRTTTDDTRFDAWGSIKNNVLLNWVDLVEEGESAGLAVMADHVTAYNLSPGEPLGLVMCYAGPGVWFDYGVTRTPDIAYSIVPHAGDWAKARLWRELASWSEPLVTQPCAKPVADDATWSLVDATDGGLEVTAVYRDGGHLLIRLFNADGDERPQRIRLAANVRRVQGVELDGRVIDELPVQHADGTAAVTLAMPRFGVRTLRLTTG
jgi:alpha-mannosidase